ncbi:MAG: T9SS type A sorting domain-containing protein, partial [Sphingobacteriales bacterium]
AGNAANGNNSTSGDFIYTTSKVLAPSATSIDENTLFSQNMRLYPNPVENVLNVEFTVPQINNTKAALEIFTVEGKLVKTENMQAKAFSPNTIYADLSGFNKGIYLAKLTVGNFSEVKKIIKQ